MKQLLITIAALVLVGCGPSEDIYKAATKGDITTIKQYLDAGNDVDAKDEAEWTVLMYAANNGRKEIAELLIAKGADVNFMDESGHTPLYAAAIDGHREIAELLIAKGADVNAKDSIGMTALDWALADIVDDKAATKKTADLLRKHGAKTGEELKSSVSTDDLETYTLSEPEGTISTLVINPDGSFRESLGFRGEANRPENTLIGSWKIEGELLVLEGTTELDSKQTIIKFNKTTGKIVSINSNGDEVPTEELGRLTIKKN